MPYVIDAHEDLAYNSLSFGRDYRRSIADTRKLEKDTKVPSITGQCSIGWQEYQQGQIAAVLGTLFVVPQQFSEGEWEGEVYSNTEEGTRRYRSQIDFYHHLCETNPEMFKLVKSQKDFQEVLKPWQESLASFPEVTHPVGIIMLLEGAEGLSSLEDLYEFHESGLNVIGPVWSGIRFCGGTRQPGSFTSEGYELLQKMSELSMVLDVSHMNSRSVLQALDRYEGAVMASHANARALLGEDPHERQLTDEAIMTLFERGGVIGVIPFNRFLNSDWKPGDDRQKVMLKTLVEQIDHMCQLAGDAQHVGIGSDFDGGFGYPEIPYEMESIADVQKLAPMLKERGYRDVDIQSVFGLNWQRFFEKNLPEK